MKCLGQSARDSGVELDILNYIQVEDFEPMAEQFVERLLLDRPPAAAVDMMVSELQQRHRDEAKLTALQNSVQAVLRACGGLGRRGEETEECEVTVTEAKLVRNSSSSNDEADKEKTEKDEKSIPRRPEKETTGEAAVKNTKKGEGVCSNDGHGARIYGMDMTLHVPCRVRNMQVGVRLGFEKLRCCVIRYELRAMPDERRHVIVDGQGKNPVVVA